MSIGGCFTCLTRYDTFYEALEKVFDVRFIIPKPKSIDDDVYEIFPENIFVHVDRELLQDYEAAKEKIFNHCNHDKDLAILDIGGYFSAIINDIKDDFGEHFLGIVEDTENGLQKYESFDGSIKCPIVQVARSPLKENEDYMVGHAVAFSIESILRNLSILINGRRVGVIGSGKIGKAAAFAMKSKQGSVSIFDQNSVRLVHAHSHGLNTQSREDILASSDILISATGNKALMGARFCIFEKWLFCRIGNIVR
ncbi:hypothetical protein CR970_03370 [Candidatus Saccharibacteria bacterium]|nr:MAG: hypothetical protein CR970_03370 [Candidatus Saccharibacteria bacterium]